MGGALSLRGSRVAPGVHYPEEAFGGEASSREAVYDIATRGCFSWDLPAPAPEVKAAEERQREAVKEEL